MTKQVLILGAQDFIGRHVAAALQSSNWASPIVAVLGRRSAPSPNCKQVRVDIAEPSSVLGALDGVDAVVNCVMDSPRRIEAVANALFTTAARVRPQPLIVHVSSMSVYGSASGEVTEESALLADLGPYSGAQLAAETIARRYPRTVVLRPGCEYGPEGELWSGRVARWLCARRLGDLGAAGDGLCNLVHIDDLVAAVLLCLQQPEATGKVFNLAIPDPPTWNEYFVRYARALGAVPVRRISGRRLSLEAKVLAPPLKLLEIAARAVGRGRFTLPPPIPPSLLRLTRQEIRVVATKAHRDLGWSCKRLEDGLAEAASWFTRTTAPTPASRPK